MKKLLHSFIMGTGMLAACSFALPVFAAEGEDSAINYAEYTAVFQSPDFMLDAVSTALEVVEGSTYNSIAPITLEKGGTFAIQNADGSLYFGAAEGSVLTEDNLSLTLTYFDGDIMKWIEDLDNLPMPIAIDVEGVYDLTVTYEGDKALVSFVPTGSGEDSAINYAEYTAVFQSPDFMLDAVSTALEVVEGSTYNSIAPITLEKGGTFAIQNADGSLYFGAAEGSVLTEDNLSLTLTYFDGDIMKWIEDLDNLPMPLAVDTEGVYDLTVVYEGEKAHVAFTPADPDKVASVAISGLKIAADAGSLSLVGLAAGSQVEVFDMAGRVACSKVASKSGMDISLAKGIYVVRVGGVSSKVIVR